ncbi:hypothetical protein J1605_009050 [Eschrichtius robustus]|uniref:Uncharacterized protein n=1 Tax=Eschrichtius robustus TaxID=9764 RepID=A0AB34GU52_ESCRO|nr:hypothetical protein J1605_009050 [Eschrichtius robustus]
MAENGDGGGPDSGQSASACNGSPLPLLSSEGFTSRSSSAVWKPAATSFTRTAGDRGKLTKSRCISKPNTYARSCADAEAAKPAHAHPPRHVTSDAPSPFPPSLSRGIVGQPPRAAGHARRRIPAAAHILPQVDTGSRRAGSVIVAHGPSCSPARGIFPDQGSNLCPLHWQADSQPLRHQGSPLSDFFKCKVGGRKEAFFFPFQWQVEPKLMGPYSGVRLQRRRLSSCGSRAQLLRGMWDLPRPGLEPVSPALAGRFSTTAPPGKPQCIHF